MLIVSRASIASEVCGKRFVSLNFVRFYAASKNRWLSRQKNDHFTKEAKLLNLRSRAAFKLMAIDDKYHLFNKISTQNILDLGFAPGSWSEVARKRTSPNSMILGVDILPCNPPEGIHSLQANILSQKTHELIRLMFANRLNLNHTQENIHEDHGYFEHMIEDQRINDSNLPEINPTPIDIILSDMYVPLPRLDGYTNNITNMPYFRLMNTSGVAIRDHLQSIDLCDAALVTAIDLLKPKGNFVCKLYSGKEDKLFEQRLTKVFKSVSRFKPTASRDESKEFYFIGLNKKSEIDKLNVFL